MKRSFIRSPYLWAIVAVAAVVAGAWLGRESYRPVITGADAPDFTFAALDGRPVSLSEFQGEKVVLVNVWATWCPPCVVEMPSMERLYTSLAGQDFEILAVSVDAPVGQVDVAGRPGGNLGAFADEHGLTFTILHDPEGTIQQLYQTTGVPESFIVGKDGVIYKKVAGPTEWDASENEQLVRRLVSSN